MKKVIIIMIALLVVVSIITTVTVTIHPWATDEWCEDKILNHPDWPGYNYLVFGDWDGISRPFNVFACDPESEFQCMIYPSFYHGQIDIFGNVVFSEL